MSFTVTATSTCPGCCANACTTLECRDRGGTAELCGWDEFAGYVSTPPKFYLEKEIGGGIVLCDFHSPSGKGPCYDDGCVSPVGWSIEVTNAWQCTPTPGCTGTNLGGTAKVEVVASYATPGSPGNVTLEFNGFANGSGCASATFSWIGRINGSIFIGSFSGPGTSTAKVSRTNGTELGFDLTLDSGCGADGAACTGTVCTGEEGSICVPECSESGSAASADLTGLQWCVPTKTSVRYQYSGSAVYVPATSCDKIDSDARQVEIINSDVGCAPPESGGTVIASSTAFDPALSAYVSPSGLNSGSFKGEISNEACSSDRQATFCDRYEQLQSEDTDEDAVVRLLASPAGAWNAWKPTGDGTGGTCLQQVCCRAAWEIRTYRTFEYKESEFRGIVSGLTPGIEVDINIPVYRRAYGVGVYELFQTLEYTETAGMDGKAIATGVVPNSEGFETYVGCTHKLATE